MNKQRREGEGGAPKEIPAIKAPYNQTVTHPEPKVSMRKGPRKLSVK